MKKILILLLVILMGTTILAAAPMNTGSAQALCFVHNKPVPCSKVYSWGLFYGQSGEPRMEKVTFFYYPLFTPNLVNNSSCKNAGTWSNGYYTYYLCIATYKLPVGCNFRYQY